VEERNEDGRHYSSLPSPARNLNRHSMYGVSGRHRIRGRQMCGSEHGRLPARLVARCAGGFSRSRTGGTRADATRRRYRVARVRAPTAIRSRWETTTQRNRSAARRRRRGRRERSTTCSWCRSARSWRYTPHGSDQSDRSTDTTISTTNRRPFEGNKVLNKLRMY
jgi:hypothetical protein